MNKEDQFLNRNEIISMAREAGAGVSTSAMPLEHPWVFLPDELERFAAFVAAKASAAAKAEEREACAKVCDALNFVDNGTPAGTRASNRHCAAAIRARGAVELRGETK